MREAKIREEAIHVFHHATHHRKRTSRSEHWRPLTGALLTGRAALTGRRRPHVPLLLTRRVQLALLIGARSRDTRARTRAATHGSHAALTGRAPCATRAALTSRAALTGRAVLTCPSARTSRGVRRACSADATAACGRRRARAARTRRIGASRRART